MTATQPTTLEQVGQRLYFRGSPYSAKDRIKALGAKWDGDQRCWWIGVAKRAAAEQLVAELNGGATAASKDAAASVGLVSHAPAYMVADKLRDEGRDAEADKVQGSTREDPARIKLTGKGEYKGRAYYLGFPSRDGTRQHLYTLPDDKGQYLDFWADTAAVKIIKRYEAREVWDGRRYSGRTETRHTTLGSIADFIRKQKRLEKQGAEACASCGKRSTRLVSDLEDGLMKCPSCCDIPSD